jgi:large subunit ribosomal protein L9
MEVILIQNIQGLGYKNDTVKVKPGYGRNYLIPQGFAIIANNSNSKKVQEEIKQAAHKAEKRKNNALEVAASVGDMVLQVGAKVGGAGKIFGAVTTLQISDLLAAKGIDIDRKQISFPVQPKEIGEYVALLDLHKEVKHEVKFEVVAE